MKASKNKNLLKKAKSRRLESIRYEEGLINES
jgi:hypothetical protein